MSFVDALTQAILPVLAIAAAGYGLGWARDVSIEPLSTVNIYVLLPALVFSSVATSSIGGGAFATLAVGVVAFNVAMVVIAESVAALLGETGPVRSGLVLTSTFSNAGNYGIPLSAFAFGAVGRTTAVLFIVVQMTTIYSIGVYVASRGSVGSWWRAIFEVFKLPLIYAVLLAGVFRYFELIPPADSTVMQVITLTGDASIPLMLILLGIQLANTDYSTTLKRIVPPVGLKMIVAPLVAIAIALVLGFADSTVARVFVLECSMPAAVVPLLLTIEYSEEAGGVDGPAYVGSTILASTLLSIPTLAVLITLLQSGIVL
ncbi:MAG: AEC family transporter [Halodesulfurarchaeum sp.]